MPDLVMHLQLAGYNGLLKMPCYLVMAPLPSGNVTHGSRHNIDTLQYMYLHQAVHSTYHMLVQFSPHEHKTCCFSYIT